MRPVLTLLALVLAVHATAGQSPRPARATITKEPPRLERLRQWLSLVEQHRPGRIDAAVEAIRVWELRWLAEVRDDLYALRRLICSINRRVPETRRSTCRPPPANTAGTILPETTVGHRNRGNTGEWVGRYESKHLADLRKLAPEIDRRGINDILKRGALVHTDIALLAPPPPMTWAVADVERILQRTVVHVSDGQQSRIDQSVDHLAMARRLLDIVTPDPRRDDFTYPERDPMVREWYRATMAVLLNTQEIVLSHEKAALELFPGADEVLFQAGALHAALASPQHAAGRRRVSIESESAELRRAEDLFRQALKANPNHLEARLRFGQVLGQRGRPNEALVELRAAAGGSDDRLLSYYAALLIAREEAGLNNVDAARAAYRQAATLYPRAQTPQIGLSELEMRAGNRSGAAQALEVVWEWGGTRRQEDDPWWNYTSAAGRAGGTLLEAIGKAFPPTGARP